MRAFLRGGNIAQAHSHQSCNECHQQALIFSHVQVENVPTLRFNAIMLLHVHKERTDNLSVIELANMFANTEHRMSVFGNFQIMTCNLLSFQRMQMLIINNHE